VRIQYSVLRFVPDPIKDESLNLGILIAAETGLRAGVFNRRTKTKVRALAPKYDFEHVERVISALSQEFNNDVQLGFGREGQERQTDGVARLHALAEGMPNQFQLTKPRPFNCADVTVGLRELYELFVSGRLLEPHDAAVPGLMTRQELRGRIARVIREWTHHSPYRVLEERQVLGKAARHFADFWIQNGVTSAAFYAMPDHPDEADLALAYRDSLPTVVRDFKEMNPHFKVFAVVPPQSLLDSEASTFLQETNRLFAGDEDINVVEVDALANERSKVIRSLLLDSHQ